MKQRDLFQALHMKYEIAIYILAEIKLRDEKNLRRDINFKKEFKTFLGLFLSKIDHNALF